MANQLILCVKSIDGICDHPDRDSRWNTLVFVENKGEDN